MEQMDQIEQIQIIHEDNDIVIINKPSGIVVNRSQTTSDMTIQDWMKKTYPESFEISKSVVEEDSVFLNRTGLVHRLDKETSGVLILAKTEEAFTKLQAQFKAREVEKEYFALAFGKISDPIIEINAPIARNPNSRTKMAIVEDGKSAVTKFEKVKVIGEKDNKMTLLKAFPRTGRTHQIRVHLAAMNHPVAGDYLYAGDRRSASSREKYGRLMLHAYKISFTHPTTNEKVSYIAEAPEVFEDL